MSKGSSAEVLVPEPVAAVTAVSTVEGAPAGVSVALEGGVLKAAASMGASPSKGTVQLGATGCTNAECGRRLLIKIPVSVHGLAPPAGPIEALEAPSPDRTAHAADQTLQDELVVTVGSPEDPGTRSEAETAAAAAGGVVAGGFEGSGIYQIRWESDQDLQEETSVLENEAAVTSVNSSTVGTYEGTSVFPVQSTLDTPEWTWPYEQVEAEGAWSKSTGSSVPVGVIDVGSVYSAHEDLNVREALGSYEPAFHATHVAGLACARNNAPGVQLGMVGLAWGCPIISAAVGGGELWTLRVLGQMHAMVHHGARIVNISLGQNASGRPADERYQGGNCANHAFQAYLGGKLSHEYGMFHQFLAGPEGQKVVWTFSAGNNCAPGTAAAWGWSASLPNVITVAATNSDRTLAAFSNYGPGVKVAAPGGISVSPQSNGLKSTAIDWDCNPWESCAAFCFYTISYCGTYGEDTGTSMAAPVVAGVAALVQGANPSMSADQVGACVSGSAGTGGAGYATAKSTVPLGDVYKQDPSLPAFSSVPIVNAAAAVECHTRVAASSYKGSGGGDGWAVALSREHVYNVFHHSASLQVACHLQVDASPCWEPKTITGPEGEGFATPGQPGLWLDQTSEKLYLFATRASDDAAGVVCIDGAASPETADPYCGFTALTGANEAFASISAVSNMAVVGTRLYAFNYVAGSTPEGDQNKLLCFDTVTAKACAGQPFDAGVGAGIVGNGSYPPPAVAALGSHVIVPITIEGHEELACYDGSSGSPCAGAWPVPESGYVSQYGAPFARSSAQGVLDGFCLPAPSDPCFDFEGTPVESPSGLKETIGATSGWNGPALLRGTRVYVPNGAMNSVECFDYASGTGCPGYPYRPEELSLLYTITPDPERPKCLWVNSDNGQGQIQDFDETGLGGCS